MQLLEIFALSGLVNSLITLGFGFFVISHSWKDKVNRLYFLLVLATALWSFSYWRWLSSFDAETALFWVRMLSVGSTLIPAFYFHWIISLLKVANKKRLVSLIYMAGILFVLVGFSDLFVSGVEKKLFFPFWPNPGILYNFYLFILYIFIVAYSYTLILKAYKQSFGIEKRRVEYIFAGAIIAFGGGLSNFFLWYNIPIPPYGNFLVAFYPILFGWATIKYRLFNIKIITTELFAIAIWIFLFIRTLASSSYNDFLANITLLVAVIFFGIFLIRSVFNEVAQKEKIENLAMKFEKAFNAEKKANEDLEITNKKLGEANKKLEELDKFKNQFFVQARHDLRTPVTSIMGYTDLIKQGSFGKIPQKAIAVLEKIEKCAERMKAMAESFLDTTQFQLGQSPLRLESNIALSPLLDKIVNELKVKADHNNIYLKFEKPENDIAITADREKIKSVLSNIINNAIKFTKQGGVTIKFTNDSEKVKISISDTGIGIPTDKLATIFERKFERTEEAKKTAEGKGVGLYLSGQIVKYHQGKTWAESEGEGKGSTFFVELPLKQMPIGKI